MRRRILALAGCALLLAAAVPFQTHGASTTLTLSPSSGSPTVGSTISVKVLVNAGQAINAVEGTVRFPTDLLEVSSLSKTSSVLTLWAVEPSFSNSWGTVAFAGGLPSPGFSRSGGTVLTMLFRTKKTGSAKLTIGSAQIAANDGEGTNVLSGTG